MNDIVSVGKFPKGDAIRSADEDSILNCDTLLKAAFGHRLLERPGITAFPYLYARFGPPWFGSDPGKEIATYILSVDKDVYVRIRCQMGEMADSFEVLYGSAAIARFVQQELNGNALYKTEVRNRLVGLLKSLYEPVYVRDIGINLFGTMDIDNQQGDDPVKLSAYAGWGLQPYRENLDLRISTVKHKENFEFPFIDQPSAQILLQGLKVVMTWATMTGDNKGEIFIDQILPVVHDALASVEHQPWQEA